MVLQLFRRWSVGFALVMATAVAQAGDALVSNLDYRRFTTLDGLPQMQTERLYQDSHGYIYIGTMSGFVRYDGRQLTPLLHGRRENIVGAHVLTSCSRSYRNESQ